MRELIFTLQETRVITFTIGVGRTQLTKVCGVIYHGEHLALGARSGHTRLAGSRQREIELVQELMLAAPEWLGDECLSDWVPSVHR